MPPKIKVTGSKIVETALDIIRKQGVSALNARGIAAELGCSTQPIFSNFKSMEELEEAVTARAYESYLGFLENEAKNKEYPRYKAFGMAYIRFAKEEKELFKLLFMCDRKGKNLTPTADFEESVQMIMKTNGIKSKEKAELFHLEMWACVHGVATMLATEYFEPSEELISKILSDTYLGLRRQYGIED